MSFMTVQKADGSHLLIVSYFDHKLAPAVVVLDAVSSAHRCSHVQSLGTETKLIPGCNVHLGF
jgi:hypothetical protein